MENVSRDWHLENARWMVLMYEPFYELPEFKKTREALDCELKRVESNRLTPTNPHA